MTVQRKIGLVAVGQTPRTDVLSVMRPMVGEGVEILEKGVLDRLSLEEMGNLGPAEGMTTIATRLADGTQVELAEEKILPMIQDKITELNREQVEFVVLLCTGHFPLFRSECPIIESQKIVDHCVASLVGSDDRLGVLVPLPEQMQGARENLSHISKNVVAESAAAYGPLEAIAKAAEGFRKSEVDWVVLHCMGYTNEHRSIIWRTCRRPVIVANSIVARTVAELLQT